MSLVVGIDLGGSGSRLVISGIDPNSPEEHLSFGPSRIGSEPISDRVIDVLQQRGSEVGSISALCIGTTGMPGLLNDAHRLAALLFDRLELRSVIVAGDCVTTHVGALGGEPGVVVAAGTGAITLGTDFGAVWNRVDGWGHLMGDAGSGSWIGRRALAAALASLDGRGGSPMLLELMMERYGSTTGLVNAVYRGGEPARELAQFAPTVADAAERGDATAAQIWREAGLALAGSVAAACVEVPARFSWGGGLFRAGDLLLAPFFEGVRQLIPGAEISEPRGGALSGALCLARDLAGGKRLPSNEFHQAYER